MHWVRREKTKQRKRGAAGEKPKAASAVASVWIEWKIQHNVE